MVLNIKIGEGCLAVSSFFLWLFLGLELIQVSYAAATLYLVVSWVISLAFLPARRKFKVEGADLIRLDKEREKEKQYSIGRICLVVLKGPVKLTVLRTAGFLAALGAWFTILLLFLALTSPRSTEATQNTVLVGIVILLIAMNFLEVRWRKTDVQQ